MSEEQQHQTEELGNILIDWLSKQKRDQKRKEKRDNKLRAELAAKAQEFDSQVRPTIDEFTESTINGVRQKVAVDRITLVDANPRSKDSGD